MYSTLQTNNTKWLRASSRQPWVPREENELNFFHDVLVSELSKHDTCVQSFQRDNGKIGGLAKRYHQRHPGSWKYFIDFYFQARQCRKDNIPAGINVRYASNVSEGILLSLRPAEHTGIPKYDENNTIYIYGPPREVWDKATLWMQGYRIERGYQWKTDIIHRCGDRINALEDENEDPTDVVSGTSYDRGEMWNFSVQKLKFSQLPSDIKESMKFTPEEAEYLSSVEACYLITLTPLYDQETLHYLLGNTQEVAEAITFQY